jgi:hypothetical protein
MAAISDASRFVSWDEKACRLWLQPRAAPTTEFSGRPSETRGNRALVSRVSLCST